MSKMVKGRLYQAKRKEVRSLSIGESPTERRTLS
jgi:hypothetical protein